MLVEITDFYHSGSTNTRAGLELEPGDSSRGARVAHVRKQNVLARLEGIAQEGADFNNGNSNNNNNTVHFSPSSSSSSSATLPSGSHPLNTTTDNTCSHLRLPIDLITPIFAPLDNKSRKVLRLKCRAMSSIVHLHTPRVYLSANSLNISVLLDLARHPWYSAQVTELVWDDTRLERTGATRFFSNTIRNDEVEQEQEQDQNQEEEEREDFMVEHIRQGLSMESDENLVGDITELLEQFEEQRKQAGQKSRAGRESKSMAPSWFRAERLMVEEKGELDRLGGVEAYDTIHQLENSNLLLMANYLERCQEMTTVFHRPGEKTPDFTADEHNIETDWENYTTLLTSQHHIETTGAHIAAFTVALEKFPKLRKLTISYTAHGRAGARCPPYYETPMIRAFRYGSDYFAPVGWYFDSASVYGRVAAETTNNSAHLPNIRPAGTDALTAVLRILSGHAAASNNNATASKHGIELHVDDGGLGAGVDLEAFEQALDGEGYVVHENVGGQIPITSRIGILAELVAQPGFDALTLHSRRQRSGVSRPVVQPRPPHRGPLRDGHPDRVTAAPSDQGQHT